MFSTAEVHHEIKRFLQRRYGDTPPQLTASHPASPWQRNPCPNEIASRTACIHISRSCRFGSSTGGGTESARGCSVAIFILNGLVVTTGQHGSQTRRPYKSIKTTWNDNFTGWAYNRRLTVCRTIYKITCTLSGVCTNFGGYIQKQAVYVYTQFPWKK